MSVPVFVDTNVLVYADDRADPEKREKAREIIRGVVRDQSVRLSLQVLQEYFVVATRKLGLDASAAKSRLQIYSQLQIVKIDHTDLLFTGSTALRSGMR